MSPEIGQAATRIALFLIITAGLLLLMVSRDSAEFVVLVLTIGIGLVMLGIVALLARIGTSRWPGPDRPPAVSPADGPSDDGPPDDGTSDDANGVRTPDISQ